MVNQVLAAMEDNNSEVKNAAVKVYVRPYFRLILWLIAVNLLVLDNWSKLCKSLISL